MSQEPTNVQEPTTTEPTQAPTEPTQTSSGFDDYDAFRSALGEEIGKHTLLDSYKSVSEFVKGAINTKKYVGQKASAFWESDNPDDISVRNDIMGIPKDASEYTWTPAEEVVGIGDEYMKQLNTELDTQKEIAKELGLSKKQFDGLANYQAKIAVERIKDHAMAQEIADKASEDELRKDWRGYAYEENMEQIETAFASVNAPTIFELIRNNPQALREAKEGWLPSVSEDSIIEQKIGYTSASIEDQLNEVESEMRSFPGSTSSAEYKSLVEKRTQLLIKDSQFKH